MRGTNVRLVLQVGPNGKLSLLLRVLRPRANAVKSHQKHVRSDRDQLLHMLSAHPSVRSVESRGKLSAEQVQQRIVRSRLAEGSKSELLACARNYRKIIASQIRHKRHTHDGLQQKVQESDKILVSLKIKLRSEHFEDVRINAQKENTEES